MHEDVAHIQTYLSARLGGTAEQTYQSVFAKEPASVG